jgi:hypothetical protein
MVRHGVVYLTKAGVGNGTIPYHCLIIPKRGVITFTGAHKYCKVQQRSTIWSTTILAATNSDPMVAVWTHASRLENQSAKGGYRNAIILLLTVPSISCCKLAPT